MNIPDPDDPDFKAELRESWGCFVAALLFLIGCACLGIACLGP